MDSRYNHHKYEQKIYQTWEEANAFVPLGDSKPVKKSFSIIMPPPNANDPLHVGHAMFIAIEDIMIRYHRMLGEDTLWLPGTDHAGIETQYVYEKKLAKQKKSRFDFDRDTLYQNIWQYVQENSDLATSQMKRLGASADWSRFKFTLDQDVQEFVLDTFEDLHKKGLIYRDFRLVNYCTKCGTGYSNLEANYQERNDPLYYIKYGPFVLATVRPETKFGDTGLAVHPDDKRYQKYIGQTITVQGLLGDFQIKVVADKHVDQDFGTGVVKVTPAHDPNDFEIGKRHGLELKQIINDRGKLTELAGKYAGLSVKKAREEVVKDLQNLGLIEKIDHHYRHSVATCYRCGRVLEPLPLSQFFIKVNDQRHSLVRDALKNLDKKETIIYGAGREKILRHWLKNLDDWNISRQIVWGIRIPVWYQIDGFESEILVSFITKNKQQKHGELKEVLKKHSLEEVAAGLQQLTASQKVPYIISRVRDKNRKKSGLMVKNAQHFIRGTDTFDTWFSSAQWPVVTLKTNQQNDFDRFYPTSVLETAYDILPFWVMRMMLMGNYLTKKPPFHEVYFHGLIRDQKGQKMSKSKGNVINPLEVVDRYGADALRFALVVRSTPGQDKAVGEADFKAARNLTNKLWNAARFVIFNFEKEADGLKTSLEKKCDLDEKFESKIKQIIKQITQELTEQKIGLAADNLYDHFWHWYCDQMIEQSKLGRLSLSKLLEGLLVFLKLFHPFIPFITETIWQELRAKKLVSEPLLILAKWPGNLE